MNGPRDALVDELDHLLPQAQCRRCGYDGCRPYAQALAEERVSLDLCPPGGEAARQALAAALDRRQEVRDVAHPAMPRRQAKIIEADCIGCTRCIQACPVDAITGAAGCMHTVVAPWCSGCDLCLPVCPTDCIEMVEAGADRPPWDADAARQRYLAREQRRIDGTLVSDDDLLVTVAHDSREALRADIRAARERRREAQIGGGQT